MSSQYSIWDEGLQASPKVAWQLSQQLTTFVQPLLAKLDALVDLRLVQTFLATLQVLVEFRHRNNGLLLSELGAYLATPEHAPAGTKRLSNLLRAAEWGSKLIEHFLWQQADARLLALEQAGEEGLLLWDESVLEKPESLALEGLCAVRSSKARRGVSYQARLLQSARWSSYFCARNELADRPFAGTNWPPDLSRHALVDDAGSFCAERSGLRHDFAR